MRLNFSGGYFHRIAHYEDNNIVSAQFPRLINQDWNIDDFNFRMTFQPKIPSCMGSLALVTRYDFVHTNIDSQWGLYPQAEILDELQSGEVKKHVISESLNWIRCRDFIAGERIIRSQSNRYSSQRHRIGARRRPNSGQFPERLLDC